MSTIHATTGVIQEKPLATNNHQVTESSTKENLFGIWAPCLTPIKSDFMIDGSRLLEHVHWLLSNGCHGIVLFGTTGEAASFSVTERIAALETLVSGGISPAKIMVGNGFTALSDTIEITQHAVGQGCRKVLMVPPFYFKDPSLAGLVAYYRHVFDKTNCPDLKVLLYHFPRMSNIPITFDLIDALIGSHGDMIVGLKDSSGEWESVRQYVQRFPKLAIFPGTDDLLLKGLKSGCVGTITATADINPHGIRRVFDLWQDGDAPESEQKSAETVRAIVFRYPLAPALKAVHEVLRSDSGWGRVRPPLTPLKEQDKVDLMNSLRQVGFGFN